MSTSVYTGLNPFNFIRKHFLQIWLWGVSYVRSYCRFKSLSMRSWSWYNDNQIYVPQPKGTETFRTHCPYLSMVPWSYEHPRAASILSTNSGNWILLNVCRAKSFIHKHAHGLLENCTGNVIKRVQNSLYVWHDGDRALSFTEFLDHTQRRTTFVELLWTSNQPYAETFTWQLTILTTDIRVSGGIRTHNLSRRVAADLRLRPRGHWGRLF
jgi:hypothetical protein